MFIFIAQELVSFINKYLLTFTSVHYPVSALIVSGLTPSSWISFSSCKVFYLHCYWRCRGSLMDCVPPELMCWSANSQRDAGRRWGFGRSLPLDEVLSSPHDGISVHVGRDQGTSSLFLLCESMAGRGPSGSQERGSSSGTESAGILLSFFKFLSKIFLK